MVDRPVPQDTDNDRVLDGNELIGGLNADHDTGFNGEGLSHILLKANLSPAIMLADPKQQEAMLETALTTSLNSLKAGVPVLEKMIADGMIPRNLLSQAQDELAAMKKVTGAFDSVDIKPEDVRGVLGHAFKVQILPGPDGPGDGPGRGGKRGREI